MLITVSIGIFTNKIIALLNKYANQLVINNVIDITKINEKSEFDKLGLFHFLGLY